ncbi:hypothetical protein DQ04_06281040 [Trypanosoma grayi]|uniref:hypothetical protein n=1 Tax=Trypanosoma grayi TaxID=71804 RepID=UPI0004F44E72|nr:hypothetical protein DQ04_06281040 [Trypanosoma grayi]KEG08869.1 hypothetical protein DQ04_06281040 [Trypanosoma grayi]
MQKPLSDEERAAKEARLQELCSQMNALGGASSSTANPSETSANAYACDDGQHSDDEEDDEFLQEAERAHEAAAGVYMCAKPMGELLGETVATGPGARRCTVGDFELLRLAKMGDLISFTEFAAVIGADPTTFRDNHERNALHYAADSGDIAMLQHLIDRKVPYTKDEKGMTPVDIAALNQHEAAVKLLAAAFPQAAEALKSYEEAVEAFARPPPRFTMTKPVPPAPKESRPHIFWKKDEGDTTTAAAASVVTNEGVAVSQLDATQHEWIIRALSGMTLSHGSHGFHNWLPPAEAATLSAVLPHATVVGATQAVEGEDTICGVVLAVPLGGSLIGKNGTVNMKNTLLVTQLAVHPSRRGANVAALLMAELQRLLREAGNSSVVFHSALQLPVPAVGLVKWYRRSIVPCSALRHRYAAEVFPDFYQYDDVLRADIVTKNALTKAFRDQKLPHCESWCTVDRTSGEQLNFLLDFVVRHAPTMFDFAYVPENTEDMLASVIADGLNAFVYVSPVTGAITDLVVLRLRSSDAETNAHKTAAQCVYSIFTTFKGTEKAEEVLILAEMLKCETVLIPSMFGFVDSDLSKAMFEELLASREYLYVLKAPTESVVPPTPLSKVAIPCTFI